MARHTTMPARTQRTPFGDVTLSSRWKRDRYYLRASGPRAALLWMFPGRGSGIQPHRRSFRIEFVPVELRSLNQDLSFKTRYGTLHREYRRVTFEKDVARHDTTYEFVAPGHPLLEALNAREEYERTHEFYLCEVCSIRFEFGEAMDFGFECPECGSPLESMENTRLVDAMDDRIASLRDELNVGVTD